MKYDWFVSLLLVSLFIFGCTTRSEATPQPDIISQDETIYPTTEGLDNYPAPQPVEENRTSIEEVPEEANPIICPNVSVAPTVVPSMLPPDVGTGYWVDHTLFEQGVNWNGWNAEAPEIFSIGGSTYEPMFCRFGEKLGQNINYQYCEALGGMIAKSVTDETGVTIDYVYHMKWIYLYHAGSYVLKEIVYENPDTQEEICTQIISTQLPVGFTPVSHVGLDESDLDCPNITIGNRVVPSQYWGAYQISEAVLGSDVNWNGWEARKVFVQDLGVYRYQSWSCDYGQYSGEDPAKMYCYMSIYSVSKSITDTEGTVLKYKKYMPEWIYAVSGQTFILKEAIYTDWDNQTNVCRYTYNEEVD